MPRPLRLIAVQKATPKMILSGPVPPIPISGFGETARPVTTTATAATVTSPAIYSFRALASSPRAGRYLGTLNPPSSTEYHDLRTRSREVRRHQPTPARPRPPVSQASSRFEIASADPSLPYDLPALVQAFEVHRPILPAVLVPKHENRPNLCRSVALIAPLHPKCPFQVGLLRVRTSLLCFLVLEYQQVGGL